VTGARLYTKKRRLAILKRVAAGATQVQIAAHIGVTRPSISRHLKALKLTGHDRATQQKIAADMLARINAPDVQVKLSEASETPTKPPSRDKIEPEPKPEPVFLAPPFDPPPKGCRYYIASKRGLCGAKKMRHGHYCETCRDKVTPRVL